MPPLNQVLGHAWDHETKDFKVVYRPLYHCGHKVDSYEAHVLAVSHFSRWDTKFQRIPSSQVPREVLGRVLPGPFWADAEWEAGPWTVPVNLVTPRSGLLPGASPQPSVGQYLEAPKSGLSGVGTRSHFPGGVADQS